MAAFTMGEHSECGVGELIGIYLWHLEARDALQLYPSA